MGGAYVENSGTFVMYCRLKVACHPRLMAYVLSQAAEEEMTCQTPEKGHRMRWSLSSSVI